MNWCNGSTPQTRGLLSECLSSGLGSSPKFMSNITFHNKNATDMQFELKHKIGQNKVNVRFTSQNFKYPVITSFEKSFGVIGGKFKINGTWDFPVFVTSDLIKEIIRNTCFVCGGLMKDSTAYQNSLVSYDDFGGDAFQRGTTLSRTGVAKQIKVRKCSECGHSHT